MAGGARSPQIVLRHGKPSAVILDIRAYESILERLQDMEDLREIQIARRRARFITLDDYIARRKHH